MDKWAKPLHNKPKPIEDIIVLINTFFDRTASPT